ncbi:MAG: helix-turn-helix domain-containing protein [bacterium]|nr:helix-turn-helix domain-containing protein [bacterium]
MDINLLKKLGFSDKSAKVYLALLSLGPSSVRKLAEKCELNRGTTYDALKWLQEKGVVNYYNKDKKQIFVAEDPVRLNNIVKENKEKLESAEKKLEKVIPELQALFNKGGERPVAKYYNKKEISKILEDVISTCEESAEKSYYIYSAEGVRKYLYEEFPTFSDVRIAKGINVKVIAVGEGGETRGLDERKYLKAKTDTPTYILIYSGKTAYISLDAKGEPVGVVIENEGVYQTQKLIFNTLWGNL